MICASNMYRDLQYLTETIGVRVAGTPQEEQAAQYIRDRFAQYVPKCSIETFPVVTRTVEEEILQVKIGDVWEKIPSRVFEMSPFTNGETLQADVVFFDSHTDHQRDDISYLRGKAVVHYGGSIGDEMEYKRIMEAKPAFMIMVDTRYTCKTHITDSLLPAFVEKYGAVPSVSVSFQDAWDMMTRQPSQATLKIAGTQGMGLSRNVIAEIPGTDPDALCIYAGAHIDSVAGSVGADDNAGGCVILLELARVLSQTPHRHTIRLIAFGAEERLSIGCAEYIRKHRKEVEKKGRFICNFDSCSTAVGWNKFIIHANTQLRDKMRSTFHAGGVYYTENLELDPCNDAFPFIAAGVPGLTLMRNNCDIGRFYHHQPDNNIRVVSMERAAELASAALPLLQEFADMPDMREIYTVVEDARADVQACWDQFYGGWR